RRSYRLFRWLVQVGLGLAEQLADTLAELLVLASHRIALIGSQRQFVAQFIALPGQAVDLVFEIFARLPLLLLGDDQLLAELVADAGGRTEIIFQLNRPRFQRANAVGIGGPAARALRAAPDSQYGHDQGDQRTLGTGHVCILQVAGPKRATGTVAASR